MNLIPLLQHSIFYGTVLSVGLSLMVLGSLYFNAEMWLGDYPPDVRAKYGPMSRKSRKQRTLFAILFFLFLAGVTVLSIIQLERVVGPLTFTAVFLHTFTMLEIFNLVDLLIIDWLILGFMRPQFAILPGTEGMAGYDDYSFAFKGFLKGTVGLAVASLLIAGLTVLLG